MVKKISFKISKTGEVTVEVTGAVGSECDDLTRPFEQKLGDLRSKQLKEVYYADNTETENQPLEDR